MAHKPTAQRDDEVSTQEYSGSDIGLSSLEP